VSALWTPPPLTGDPAADLEALVRSCPTPALLADVMSTLGPDEVSVVERVIADVSKAGWRASPAAMAHKLTNGAFRRYRYADLLSEKFVDAVEGRSIRQIWNLPARYGKSLIGSRYGPAWAYDRTLGATRLILASYGDTLAQENAIAVRDFLIEHADVLGARLRRDRRRMDRFVTTQGGGLIAAGVGSALTGFGGNGAVIDDPFKNWQEAHSEARRKEVWDWYRAVLRTRLEEEQSWIILVMTRWHEEDLAGMLLNAELNEDGEAWELIRLPAICDDEANDPLDRKLGEPLEPLRFSLEAVRARARALGTYLAAGLEQQRPAPEEGTDIMRGWWKWYDTPPPRYDDGLTSWDMKLKEKDVGDYVVGQAWGRTGADYWLADQLRGRFNFPTTKAAIVLLHVRNPWARRHIVENTGNGPEVITELREPQRGYSLSSETIGALGITMDEIPLVERVMRRGMPALIPENPKGDKRARMRAESGKIEGGNVHVPNRAGIGELLVTEAATFPNGAHDDQVDAMSQALKRLAGGAAKVRSAKGRAVRTPAAAARALGGRNGGRVGGNGNGNGNGKITVGRAVRRR
jgi:hypothetical protein